MIAAVTTMIPDEDGYSENPLIIEAEGYRVVVAFDFKLKSWTITHDRDALIDAVTSRGSSVHILEQS